MAFFIELTEFETKKSEYFNVHHIVKFVASGEGSFLVNSYGNIHKVTQSPAEICKMLDTSHEFVRTVKYLEGNYRKR